MNELFKKQLQEFEDNLLAESKNNEGGLLICEINIFRKHASIFQTQILEAVMTKIKELKFLDSPPDCYVRGYNKALSDLQDKLKTIK